MIMIMEAHVIRYKGYIAYKEGVLKSANPYSDGDEKSGEALEWESGWEYAAE
jgi:hypothetical protein